MASSCNALQVPSFASDHQEHKLADQLMQACQIKGHTNRNNDLLRGIGAVPNQALALCLHPKPYLRNTAP
jgi:hypothetical protein